MVERTRRRYDAERVGTFCAVHVFQHYGCGFPYRSFLFFERPPLSNLTFEPFKKPKGKKRRVLIIYMIQNIDIHI